MAGTVQLKQEYRAITKLLRDIIFQFDDSATSLPYVKGIVEMRKVWRNIS